MNNKIIIPLVGVLVVAVIIFVLQLQVTEVDEELNGEDHTETEVVNLSIEAEGRQFYLDGRSNPDIVVSEGDEVVIEVVSIARTHDFVIDEFSVATQMLSDGDSEIIEFIADQKGEFEYYCSVGNHREEGMYGSFIVEE